MFPQFSFHRKMTAHFVKRAWFQYPYIRHNITASIFSWTDQTFFQEHRRCSKTERGYRLRRDPNLGSPAPHCRGQGPSRRVFITCGPIKMLFFFFIYSCIFFFPFSRLAHPDTLNFTPLPLLCLQATSHSLRWRRASSSRFFFLLYPFSLHWFFFSFLVPSPLSACPDYFLVCFSFACRMWSSIEC